MTDKKQLNKEDLSKDMQFLKEFFESPLWNDKKYLEGTMHEKERLNFLKKNMKGKSSEIVDKMLIGVLKIYIKEELVTNMNYKKINYLMNFMPEFLKYKKKISDYINEVISQVKKESSLMEAKNAEFIKNNCSSKSLHSVFISIQEKNIKKLSSYDPLLFNRCYGKVRELDFTPLQHVINAGWYEGSKFILQQSSTNALFYGFNLPSPYLSACMQGNDEDGIVRYLSLFFEFKKKISQEIFARIMSTAERNCHYKVCLLFCSNWKSIVGLNPNWSNDNFRIYLSRMLKQSVTTMVENEDGTKEKQNFHFICPITGSMPKTLGHIIYNSCKIRYATNDQINSNTQALIEILEDLGFNKMNILLEVDEDDNAFMKVQMAYESKPPKKALDAMFAQQELLKRYKSHFIIDIITDFAASKLEIDSNTMSMWILPNKEHPMNRRFLRIK